MRNRTPVTSGFRWMGWVAITAGALLLSGCFTLSIHPLYDAETLVTPQELPGLVGDWGDPESDLEIWRFEVASSNRFRLTIFDGERPHEPDSAGVFEAHVVRLGDTLFLDLFPEEPDGVSEVFLAHVIPAHSFLKMEFEGDILTLAIMDETRLKQGLESGEYVLDHQKAHETLVLTSGTADLQEFLDAHGAEIYDEGESMRRR